VPVTYISVNDTYGNNISVVPPNAKYTGLDGVVAVNLPKNVFVQYISIHVLTIYVCPLVNEHSTDHA
jgi:hypothetical protein